MKRGVFALATPALAGWDTQKGEVPPSAETAARWRQLVVSGLDWALGLGFAVDQPEVEPPRNLQSFLFVGDAAGLEQSFAALFPQLFHRPAKPLPSFVLQPLEMGIIKYRRFHRKGAVGGVCGILEHSRYRDDQAVVQPRLLL
jgi:hypothetical protein